MKFNNIFQYLLNEHINSLGELLRLKAKCIEYFIIHKELHSDLKKFRYSIFDRLILNDNGKWTYHKLKDRDLEIETLREYFMLDIYRQRIFKGSEELLK